jgi:Sulfotransferase family
VIYVCVPKCASSCIKTTLSALVGRNLQTPEEAYERRLSGLKAPKHVSLATLWHLATSPSALRFAFVRNPYARLVSCWASKFRPTGEDLRALTTNLAITFLRRPPARDLIARCRLLNRNPELAVGLIVVYPEGDEDDEG